MGKAVRRYLPQPKELLLKGGGCAVDFSVRRALRAPLRADWQTEHSVGFVRADEAHDRMDTAAYLRLFSGWQAHGT